MLPHITSLLHQLRHCSAKFKSSALFVAFFFSVQKSFVDLSELPKLVLSSEQSCTLSSPFKTLGLITNRREFSPPPRSATNRKSRHEPSWGQRKPLPAWPFWEAAAAVRHVLWRLRRNCRRSRRIGSGGTRERRESPFKDASLG